MLVLLEMKLCGKPVARQQLTTNRPVRRRAGAGGHRIALAQGLWRGEWQPQPGFAGYGVLLQQTGGGTKLQFVLSRLLDGVAATIGHTATGTQVNKHRLVARLQPVGIA